MEFKEQILNESLEKILTTYPELEDPIIKCYENWENKAEKVTEVQFRSKFVESVYSECKEELLQFGASDEHSKEITVGIISEFMNLGIDLFDQSEKATYVLNK